MLMKVAERRDYVDYLLCARNILLKSRPMFCCRENQLRDRFKNGIPEQKSK